MEERNVIEFNTIEDIINTIHFGNKDSFLIDFKAWLEIILNTTQTLRLSIEIGGTEEQKGQYSTIKNSELIGCNSMKWVDDGMHNISINVTVKD